MMDEITQKHLDRARVRGAPSVIPGTAGMISPYDLREIRRQTVRALALDLDADFPVSALRDGHAKLMQAAAVQKLRVLEQPMFALHGDPMEDVPHEWRWELLLPVRGPAKADEGEALRVTRIHGGMYLETMTQKGFADLHNLYTYFLGDLLPRRKQQLTRPILYHRVTSGLESDDTRKLALAVFIPYYLSLKAPTKLVTREEMG